jgi:hypothetical protein
MVLGAGLGLVASASAMTSEQMSSELRHRAPRQWTIELPDESWFAVSGSIAIPHAGGEGFAAVLEGTELRLDTDGDGELDRSIRATADDYGVRRARVVLHGQRADGGEFAYGVRLRDEGAGWRWAPGGIMVGTVETDAGSTLITIIDRNGNGRWNDVGEDAMVIGRGNAACYLSRSVFIAGELWALEVDADGAEIRLASYDGPTARLDMTTGFSSSARLVSAIVMSIDGSHSFDLAPFDAPIDVPAGSYEIVAGRIGLGQQSVKVGAGRAEPITLAAGAERTFDWGGPVAAEFDYRRQGDEVVFHPDAIWYYGAAGEQYAHWSPIGKSPQFTVRDRHSGSVLEVLILPGSC